MPSKVRVYGKAQNRTSLGIMHAYLVMYPQATVEDLRKAFPKADINPDSGVSEIFVHDSEPDYKASGEWYFEKEDEVLVLEDGSKVAVCMMWTKASFDRLVKHAKLYDIEVAEFEKGQRGEKGGFRLEYLNGYVPPVAVVKKSNTWLWILLAALVVIAILVILLLMKGCQKPAEPQIVEVEKVVVVHDTLYVQQIEEIEKNFNAAEFVKCKADLSESAKFVLHDLAKIMQKNPEIRLRLEGHTSAEGEAEFNQKLSEARAQAAVTFLVEHEGIDASRLEAVGKGSTELKNTADPMASENRRTEFIVLE